MTGIKKIDVSMQFDFEKIEVGEIVLGGKEIYFKYYPSFIGLGVEISPIKLPLSDKTYNADRLPFDGLYGVFNDSLPDGWGRLLIDRKLGNRGVSLASVTQLDRLTFVGDGGMGALMYSPKEEMGGEVDNNLNLEFISEEIQEVQEVQEGLSEGVIEKLIDLGGSSGGARPKIFVGYNKSTDHLIHGTNELPEGYEHWIIKFPTSNDYPDIANIELAYYKMALDAGIEMNESRLFKDVKGKAYFGTKRFDRIGNDRLHMHSAAGLMHDDFRRSGMDYGHLMDCGFKLVKHVGVYEKILRLAAFNIYAHNRDDHSNNFAFLMNSKGEWSFAPAYDLTFSSSSHGFHSTTIAGESESPGKANLLELAEEFMVKKMDILIDKVQQVIKNWKQYAEDCDVSKKNTKMIESVLKRNLKL